MNSVGDKMSSRMDKYYENSELMESRTKRNERLYQEISQNDLEDINLSSNAHVIGDNENNIDINKIKELLEKKYYEAPKKSNVLQMPADSSMDMVEDETTKEYDINAILEKARSDKEVDYERERLKKIHDTQYDILKSLDVEKESSENKVTSDKENLMQLIHTITEKEMTRELNPLDILTDLKGNENTVVLDGISKDIKSQDLKNTVKEEVKKEVDKSFYTNSLSFTQSDFDDFNDLKEDVELNKIMVRVLLAIVVIVLIVGLVFLINTFFHLGWF